MSVKVREYPQFYFVVYRREGLQGLDELKREFGNLTGMSARVKDVAVDLTGEQYITSPEIGALVRLMSGLEKHGKSVMLIASQSVKKFVMTTNLHRAPNLEIYDDHRQFIEIIQKTARKAAPPPPVSPDPST